MDILKGINFPVKQVEWMKAFVTTESANVLVNGSPSGSFLWIKGYTKAILYHSSSF